jgi:type I restriction-modification system DNA methylase subunit
MNHNGNNIDARLWAAADELRANSKLKSSEYSMPVLGLIFLRFADHKFQATAKELLATLKEKKLVLDWRKRQQSRADVRVTIAKMLDAGLPSVYTKELFEKKITAVFQHVYDAYYGVGQSVYAGV